MCNHLQESKFLQVTFFLTTFAFSLLSIGTAAPSVSSYVVHFKVRSRFDVLVVHLYLAGCFMFHEVSLHGILWKHFLTLRTWDSLISQSLEMDMQLEVKQRSPKPGQEFLVLSAAPLSFCASQCAFSMCLGEAAFHIQGMEPERENQSDKSVGCSLRI